MAGLAGMGLSFGSIINTTRKYGQALSDLYAITGVTTERLAAFNNAAKEMSRTTKYGVTEAVEALNLMAASKPELVKTAGSLESVTKSALTLAQASGMDLNSAVNAVSLSLNQFGASASEADRFINVLAAGSRAGRSDIDSTTQAIKNSGVAASQSKIPFEQLNAAIQTLSESGIKGSKAGTDFSKVLLRLERSTDASLKPSVVGLDVALDNLAKKNLSTTQAMKLFGIQNVTTASILVNNRARLSELKNELTGTNTAYEQAATRINNLNGDITGLSGAFEGAAIAIGNSANGPLRKGVQSATSAINYLSDNFSAVSDIALYTLVPILANKLTAGLRTSATAWISNEAAMKKAAVQQVATANATIASSQATRAQAIAQNQWMATQSVINRQNGLAVSYQAAYARNARLITEATIAETAAKRQLAAANTQLSITSRAAAASGGLMRGALGFLGGPMGIAVMAAAGLAMFAASAISAKNPTDDFSASVRQLTSDLRTLQLDEVNKKIAKGNELLGDARNRWKALDFAKNNGGDVS
ncbi:phage tail tape measure protein, TP901 family, core region [Budvicia aquatica]|uniref:Phage tail tape measure protein, TP901 family, core region n=2 Tax=Budvicia aquatica TaxID=82979 RepID=A0A484ZV30_9GAMM|nr:phage tail tape measure protein, TP901 family, core region [Budvicia aquatica]